uniref:Ig-like domain-containing protein n=1 Tax=Chrysemys picta bellii TaxID=8478 RepID=A0A8C3HNF0_CHRPI
QSRIILSYVSPPLTACLFVNPEGSYPKPSIAVSPGGVIPVGGNVTIRCRHQRLGMRILLYKAGDGNYLTYTDPAGSEAEFPITSARREHGGSYTCRYSNRTVRVAYSEPSDPVQIIVAGERPSPAPRLPAPHPGPRQDVRFFLHKAGDLNPQRQMDSAGDGAEFLIPTVGRQHGGNYSCSYRNRSHPFISSQPSHPVQLVVAGEGPSSVSLLPAPHPAGHMSVTIRCECRCAGARVLLSKAGDPDAWRLMDPTGNVAEFPIRNVNRGDAGNYSCQYSTKSDLSVWLEPSDPVELVVTGEGPGYTFPVPHPDGLSAGLGPDGTLRLEELPLRWAHRARLGAAAGGRRGPTHWLSHANSCPGLSVGSGDAASDPGAGIMIAPQVSVPLLSLQQAPPAPFLPPLSPYTSPALYFYCTNPQSFLLPCPPNLPTPGGL